MKLKVLLFPALVVIIITLLIWMVYPAYSNGTDGLKEKLKELKTEKEKLASVDSKGENISSLSSQIAANAEKKGILFEYLPENIKEEEIIDNLNYLAGKDNLLVYDLNVSREKSVEAEPGTITLGEAEGLTSPGADLSASASPVIPWPAVKDIKVDMSVAGNYNGMKDMLDKIYRLGRFNQVSTVEIKKPITSDKDTGDNLEFDAVFNFKFLNKISTLSDLDNGVFSNKSFNMKVISDIENQKSTNMLNLEADQTGKSNPFFP